MGKSVDIHILRVFVNGIGKYGNPLGIVLDKNQKLDSLARQRIATNLSFSESVFIKDLTTGNVSIFNPTQEVKFAGHALVGTAYFLSKFLNKPISFLECKAGRVKTWQENDLTWIRAELTNTPPWHHKQLPDVSSVENIKDKPKEHTMVWTWINKEKGQIRARTFAPDWGIPEDQANGSGSMQLAVILKREIEILHGEGSLIYARPKGVDDAEVGGRVKEGSPRTLTL